MDYDVILIGTGAGSYISAVRLLKHKKKVLMIEKDKFAGECTNYGCIPSKTLIEMSESVHYLETMPGMNMNYKLDMKEWQKWKESILLTYE